MERKIVFLDIDGVLQPVSSQERFEHINYKDPEQGDMPKLYMRLEYKFNIDFRKYNQYDVAAVYYDWDKTAVELLKLILSITGAQIVLSSDWKMDGFDRMKDFFTIYGLEKYYIDITKYTSAKDFDKAFMEETERKYKEENGPKSFICSRSMEILEWLNRNPDVKKWVAIDDMKLYGIEQNFVNTRYRYTCEDAEKTFRILTD